MLYHGSVGEFKVKNATFVYAYFFDIALLFFIKKTLFYHFHFFFFWIIEFPQQNINQSEIGVMVRD